MQCRNPKQGINLKIKTHLLTLLLLAPTWSFAATTAYDGQWDIVIQCTASSGTSFIRTFPKSVIQNGTGSFAKPGRLSDFRLDIEFSDTQISLVNIATERKDPSIVWNLSLQGEMVQPNAFHLAGNQEKVGDANPKYQFACTANGARTMPDQQPQH